MSSRTQRIRRLLPAAIVGAATGLALTGCVPGVLAPEESPTPTPQPSASPSETPAPEPAPTEEPTAAPPETALPTTPPIAGELPCDEVYTAEQLYEFNPNFAPSSDEGSLPGAIGDIADAGGTVCAYQHVTGSDRLIVGVLSDATGFAAPEFSTEGDIGIATAPAGGTIVSVASQYFAQLRDAQPVLDQVIENVG